MIASEEASPRGNTSPRTVLLFLLGFLGLGAIGGGGLLIASPDGALLGMPVAMLAKSPFPNFLVPGVILFCMLGLGPIGAIVALLVKPQSELAERFNIFKDMHWAWTYSIYLAFALILWIQLEIVFLGAAHWLHTAYIVLALVLITVTLLPSVRRLYRK